MLGLCMFSQAKNLISIEKTSHKINLANHPPHCFACSLDRDFSNHGHACIAFLPYICMPNCGIAHSMSKLGLHGMGDYQTNAQPQLLFFFCCKQKKCEAKHELVQVNTSSCGARLANSHSFGVRLKQLSIPNSSFRVRKIEDIGPISTSFIHDIIKKIAQLSTMHTFSLVQHVVAFIKQCSKAVAYI